MAVEEVRARLRRKLVRMVGMEEADLLLGPPGGWDEVVTRELLHLEVSLIDTRLVALDQRLDRLDQRMDRFEARMEGLEREMRALTWKMVAAMTGLLGALVAAIKL